MPKRGTSGGGRVPKEAMLLAEASESIAPYGVIGHRHTSEIEQMAQEVAGRRFSCSSRRIWCRWCGVCCRLCMRACATQA